MNDGIAALIMAVIFLVLVAFCMGTLIGQPETFEVNEPQHWTITQCMLKNETPQSFDFECFSRYMKDYDKRIYEQDILTCDCSTETPFP